MRSALFFVALHPIVLLDSLLPVTRSPMKIGNSNDAKGIGLNLVDQAEWKAVGQTPTCVLRHCRLGIGVFDDPCDCSIDLLRKFETKAGLKLFVILNGSVEFNLGVRMKIESHR